MTRKDPVMLRQWEMRTALWLAVTAIVLVVAMLVMAVVTVGKASIAAEERSDRIVEQVLMELRNPGPDSERRELFDRIERIERMLEGD